MQDAPPPVSAEDEPHVRRAERHVRPADIRGLRRWLIVAAVWATAATAIAVIALISANEAKDENAEAGRRSVRTAAEISDAQRRLDERIGEIERRLDDLPVAEDVADLDSRLKAVEEANGRTSDQIDELTGSLDDLETRLESLEESPDGSGQGTETTP
jgi:DNA repair ATPase RecN